MPLWFVIIALCVLGAACGKRGSPLAPIVRIPAAVTTIAARQVASDVYVTLTVPRQNVDATVPADVTRIDVYGYTGRTPPPPARFTALGTIVGSIPIVPAPPPGAIDPPPPDPAKGGIQGLPVTIVDTLSAAERAQGRVDPPVVRGGPPLPALPAPAVTPPLRRFYMAIPFGPRERPGPTGPTADVTLTETLQPPTDVAAAYTAVSAIVTFEPAGGLIGALLEAREIPLEPPPFAEDTTAAAATVLAAVPGGDVAPLPPGPTRYNLYRELEPDPLAMPGQAAPRVPWLAAAPMPVAALTAPRHVEPVEFERARCYTVRAVRGVAAAAVESDPTPPLCVRFVDVFPPAPPAAPAAVPAAGAISLIWEPNAELDLGGYLVLRGEAGDATLAPLTTAPIFEASYRDTAVKPGTRYVYAIQAVDDRLPVGNVSAPSPPVEETAR